MSAHAIRTAHWRFIRTAHWRFNRTAHWRFNEQPNQDQTAASLAVYGFTTGLNE
ncbi:MAG TPA: hypothetical protein VKF81_09505 [Blastocatellia bacterium]|nr:hypothetical protein [Blastocatellia bacterium]